MVNRHTGFTANLLMLGRVVDLPIDLPVQGGSNEGDSCHLSTFIGNLKNIRELGRRELRRNLVRQKLILMRAYRSIIIAQ